MDVLSTLSAGAFYAVMTGLLITALVTVTTRNLFHSAIFLAFTLLGVAVIYFFLDAEFLAGAQILLYVGAIMTLVIFAIMLTFRISDPNVPQSNKQKFPALLMVLWLAIFVISAVLKAPWYITDSPRHIDAVSIGKALMGAFVFPFELVSIVLLVALIGAIAIARSDK